MLRARKLLLLTSVIGVILATKPNEERRYPKVNPPGTDIIHPAGFTEDFVPIYWGPGQDTPDEEDGGYLPPKVWKGRSLLVVPKVVRFIYEPYTYKFDDGGNPPPDGDDNPPDTDCPDWEMIQETKFWGLYQERFSRSQSPAGLDDFQYDVQKYTYQRNWHQGKNQEVTMLADGADVGTGCYGGEFIMGSSDPFQLHNGGAIANPIETYGTVIITIRRQKQSIYILTGAPAFDLDGEPIYESRLPLISSNGIETVFEGAAKDGVQGYHVLFWHIKLWRRDQGSYYEFTQTVGIDQPAGQEPKDEDDPPCNAPITGVEYK